MTEAHDVRIERVIDVPLDAVWRAWTEHQEEWFCPRPWRMEIVEQELRAGGRSAMVMHGPDGEAHAMEGVVLEVVPERRIVTTDAFTHGWRPQGPFMVRIDEFADAGDGRTHYVAIARHWSAEAHASHVEMGIEHGWNAATDQLVEVARRLAAQP